MYDLRRIAYALAYVRITGNHLSCITHFLSHLFCRMHDTQQIQYR